MTILQAVRNLPLFSHMEEAEIEKILTCTGAALCRFGRGDLIARENQPLRRAGILMNGSVLLVRDDAEGNRVVLAEAAFGELVGLFPLSRSARSEGAYVVAGSDAELLMLDAAKLVGGCELQCLTHSRLLRNMLSILEEKNYGLIRKQCHMAKRTLRGKLSSYLTEQAERRGSNRFTIELNRQALSDYLGADRSALSAELSRMKRDGLIDYHREDFKILRPLSGS